VTLGPVERLVLRTYLGPQDLPAIATVVNETNRADGYEEIETPETLAIEFAHPSGWEPERDWFLAEVSGVLAATSRARSYRLASGERIYRTEGWVLPSWRGRGIGRQLLRHTERRLRTRAREDPFDGARFLEIWASTTDPAARQLFESEGYRPVRFFFHMVRPTLDALEPRPLPDGFDIRPVLTDDLNRIIAGLDEAFAENWGASQHTAVDQELFLADPGTDPGRWMVAWAGTDVAGLVVPQVYEHANAAFGRRHALLRSVAVRKPWRRRGLATALIAEALGRLRAEGFDSADLWVDADNQDAALGLYERMGFATDLTTVAYRKPLEAVSTDRS
jgi:mycothiol synthase